MFVMLHNKVKILWNNGNVDKKSLDCWSKTEGKVSHMLSAHAHISDWLTCWMAYTAILITNRGVIILLRIEAFTAQSRERRASQGLLDRLCRSGDTAMRSGRCFIQREQVGDPHWRRFTLCSCETITIMGYRAEKSWGNARWAIGLQERTTSAIL